MPFNGRARKQAECGFCDFEACAECVKRYLLDSPEDAHCMQCRNAWDRKTLVAATNKAFVAKTYRAHVETRLFNLERAKMPATMESVEARRVLNNLRDMNRDLHKTMMRSYAAAAFTYGPYGALVLRDPEAVPPAELDVYNDNVRRIAYIMRNDRVPPEDFLAAEQAAPKPPSYVRGCPRDGCSGLLARDFVCTACRLECCNQCYEPLGAGTGVNACHVCDPDAVETAKLLAKETKPCPTCAAPISKVSGCDQMWCNQCHTTFSWEKGEIQRKGVIHNPHYYEWLRARGVEAGAHMIGGGDALDPEAGGDVGNDPTRFLPSAMRFGNWIAPYYHNMQGYKLFGMRQLVSHWASVVWDMYRDPTEEVLDNRELRIQFIMGQLKEDAFKREIYLRKQRVEKNRHVADHLLKLFASVGDTFKRAMRSGPVTVEAIEAALGEIDVSRKAYNAAMNALNEDYTSMVSFVTPSFGHVLRKQYEDEAV
jgi:hypothetical protein